MNKSTNNAVLLGQLNTMKSAFEKLIDNHKQEIDKLRNIKANRG